MDLTKAFGRPLATIGGGLVDMIVPHQCVLCRRFADTTGLCAACWATPPRLAAIRGCFHYTGSARDLILAFKHGDGLQLTPFLTRLMARLFIELVKDDTLVVPIPLHRRRYYRRRYNQAAELARHLCAVTGLGMFAPHMLIRRRATRSQGGLSRHQRMRNVTGAVAVPPSATEIASSPADGSLSLTGLIVIVTVP